MHVLHLAGESCTTQAPFEYAVTNVATPPSVSPWRFPTSLGFTGSRTVLSAAGKSSRISRSDAVGGIHVGGMEDPYPVARWPGFPVARWPGGPVARFPGGPVSRYPGGRDLNHRLHLAPCTMNDDPPTKRLFVPPEAPDRTPPRPRAEPARTPQSTEPTARRGGLPHHQFG